MANRDSPKIWREVLAYLAKKKLAEFTAADVADGFGMEYANAAQLLKRLQTWGHVRVIGFDPAVHANPKTKGKGGRRRKVYELTEHGLKSAKYHAEGA